MLNALIIDDQRINATMLEQMIQRFCPNLNVLGISSNITEGYQLIHQLRPDLIFLDVELSSDDTGFDLLAMFRSPSFKTIFITAHSHYAVDAFREHAVDYLLKPVDIQQLQVAVARAEDALKQRVHEAASPPLRPVSRVSLPTQEGYVFIHPDTILYCEASGSYTNFHFQDGKRMTVSMHLKECEAILPPGIFCRIHNSYIVNISAVTKYIRGRVGTIVLSNNVHLEVSAARKDPFLKLIRNL